MSTEHQSCTSGSSPPVTLANATAGRKPRGRVDARSRTPKPVQNPDGGAKEVVHTSKPVVLFRDLSDWAKAWVHSVPEEDVLLVEYCVRMGIPHRFVKKTINPHSIAHLCRDEALRLIYISEGRGKFSLSVLDWFGGGRNLSFTPSFGPFGKVMIDGRLLNSRDILKISYTLAPDTPIAGDASRNLANAKVPLGCQSYDVVVVQDIYQQGSTPFEGFGPSTVSLLVSKSTSGHIYVANRMFIGHAGADDFGNGKREQVFYRNEAGLIISSPDDDSTAYAAHPDTNWLMESRSFGGFDLVPLNKVGPYSLVRVARSLKGAQPLGPSMRREEDFVMIDLFRRRWKNTVLRVLGLDQIAVIARLAGVTKTLVHAPTYISLGLKFSVKSPNGQILDSLVGKVTSVFERDFQCSALGVRFPSIYKRALEGTVQACLHADRHLNAERFLALRLQNAPSEGWLSALRSSSTPGVAVSGWWKKWIALCGVLGFAAFKFLPGAYLLKTRPVVSAVLEEGVAWISEPLALCGITHEFLSSVEQNPLGATATLAMHGGLSVLRSCGVGGRICAVAIHVAWNAWHTRTRVTGRYDSFKRMYSAGNHPEVGRGVWEPVPAGESLPAYQTRIEAGPVHFRGEVHIEVDGVIVTAPEAFELLADNTAKNRTFPILATNRLLHQPANTEKNLLAAILHRLHADPFKENPFSEKVRHSNWKVLARVLIDNKLLDSDPDFQLSHAECFTLMGKKGVRLERAYADIVQGRTLRLGKTINLKWNETLSVSKDVGGILTMKPRAIQNLVPEVHALMSPFARVLNKLMHDSFDGKVTFIDGRPIRIIFGSGSTGDQLSAIGNLMMDGVFTVVVSGDDSVVAFGDESRDGAPYGEADQSAFDHTQDDGPNKFFQSMVQRYLGFPKEFTDLAYNSCASGYIARKGRLFMRGECGTQMPTGITTTTTYNSLATAMFWVFWFINRDLDVVTAGQMLGFKVKYEPRHSIQQATFLKGWWLPSPAGDLTWLPLPSACLKLGKMINDPVEVTAFKRGGRSTRRTPQEAVEMCAFALASSYQNVSEDYPIFGAFLGVLRRLGKQSATALRRLEEGNKPFVGNHIFSRSEAVDAINERYGISFAEILDVERLLSQITVLPAYVEHVVFDKLVEVDY